MFSLRYLINLVLFLKEFEKRVFDVVPHREVKIDNQESSTQKAYTNTSLQKILRIFYQRLQGETHLSRRMSPIFRIN